MPRIPATHVGNMPDGTQVYRPLLTVTVAAGKKSLLYPAVLDSGADNSILTFDLVEPLGLKWAQMTDARMEMGAGGPFETRSCRGQIYYDGTLIRDGLRVAEAREGVSFLLLGRSDFFRLHRASFFWDEEPPSFEVERI